MLAIATPRDHDHGDAMENFGGDNFSDAFSGRDLLDDIDFDDIFVGLDAGELPDLEVDPSEIFGDLSSQEQSVTTSSMEGKSGGDAEVLDETSGGDREIEDEDGAPDNSSGVSGDGDAVGKAGDAPTKNSHAGKKKVKVDWTPELHRRFVQAVEQLGVEKAVPSKILEIMGIKGLTRHNIASHLQKYRSHRKHVLAREAEAATWGHRRRMYSGGGAAVAKRGVTASAAWVAPLPMMGFPPVPAMQHYRPLHVWGHPTADHAMMPMWPRPMVHSGPPFPHWGHAPLPSDPSSFWHHFPRGMPQVAPCLPPQQPTQPTRVKGKPVAAIPPPSPPPAMYKPETTIPTVAKQLQMELLPSNECIDAALGDVLTNPWLPLPLGLKPPSMESVMGELQRQGISRVPPSCA